MARVLLLKRGPEDDVIAAVVRESGGSPFLVEQLWFPSKDGTKVSMHVIRRRDMKRDGSTPLPFHGSRAGFARR